MKNRALLGGWIGWASVAIPAATFVYFLQFISKIASGETIRPVINWVPSLDVSLSFWIDGLSLTFALLITGIGTLVMLFSARYLSYQAHYPRFVLFLLLFMGGMMGLVLADNLLLLFVYWEVTTITSYLLIGYLSDQEKSRRSALQALLVTGAGGLALLAGIILIGIAGGSFELSELRQIELKDHPWITGITVLILLGALTKSAQFPFHFWLPNAMAAPTPVSAFLHSATMVKAGVYLMARLNPNLGGSDLWIWTLCLLGGFTAVFASILALRQTDIKQVLAYTTLMALGTLTLFIGIGTKEALKGMMLFLIVHSLYKAALFLMIGVVDYKTGTREISQLRGLGTVMPFTAVAALLAAASMAGLPPLVGFIGKEFLYKAGFAALEAGTLGWLAYWALIMTFAASAMMFAVAGIVSVRPFFGSLSETPKQAAEGPWAMLAGPVLLASLGLLFGLWPNGLEPLVGPATTAVYGEPVKVDLYLWGGINSALILSVVTVATGLALYLVSDKLRSALNAIANALPIHFDRGWDHVLTGLAAVAKWQTAVLQHGVLRHYTAVIFAFFAGVLAYGTWNAQLWTVPVPLEGLVFKHWAILILITAGAFVTAVTNSRMTAIAALGVVGIGVALIFIIYSAPDVAITQLLVETLVVVLVAVAMLKLPLLDKEHVATFRAFHAFIALAIGAMTTLVLLNVLALPLDRSLSDWFDITAWPDAFGRNVVNVILVDFRALDTFGEVAVIVIAAVASYAVLQSAKQKENTK